MKILHTADWHIGKILHKHALEDELRLFFDWLLSTMAHEHIYVLLVAGDVFDIANPSSKDKELYYGLLKKLIGRNIKIIITGGNHDSVGFLNAPKEILNELNITVVGGATDNIEDELIEVRNDNGELTLVVAAVPFLRDKDLRNKETDAQFSNRTEAIREGIKKHYHDLAEICNKKYANIPLIAMGHLYTVGSQASDSEREIHVGNAAAIDANAFPIVFDYVALGHIHRPQVVGSNEMIRYSGSPIALSFSEKSDSKSVVVIEVKNGNILEPRTLNIPKVRELKKISGDLETVKSKLSQYSPDFPLTSFVEIEVNEIEFASQIISEVEDLKQAYEEHQTFKILKGRTNFERGLKDTSDLFVQGDNIEDLSPFDVFTKRAELETFEKDKLEILQTAFRQLLEEVEQEEL